MVICSDLYSCVSVDVDADAMVESIAGGVCCCSRVCSVGLQSMIQQHRSQRECAVE